LLGDDARRISERLQVENRNYAWCWLTLLDIHEAAASYLFLVRCAIIVGWVLRIFSQVRGTISGT
jgi:hypothetical protein